MDMTGNKTCVLGAGRSGIAAAQVMRGLGADVTLWDGKKPETLSEELIALSKEGVHLELGDAASDFLAKMKLVVTSPGIAQEHPLLQQAVLLGIPVWSEVELAYRLCRAPMVAITGTNGKTTTTTLLGELAKTTFAKVAVGGNIGDPLSLQVTPLTENDLAVAEISSFQLEWVDKFAPHVAAILNITPDHMDRHKTLEGYTAMKERIFLGQSQDDYVLLNHDDSGVRALAPHCKGRVVYFSRLTTLDEGVFVAKGQVCIRWQGQQHAVFNLSELQIKGDHNVENVLAACGTAFFAGIAPDKMAAVLANFRGVEHRIEWVRAVDGVDYYNDSKATNPESTIKAIEAFEEKLLLIAGGYDKHTDLTPMMKLLAQRNALLILIGAAADRFADAAAQNGVVTIRRAVDMAAAVALAKESAEKGQVVLLSPACASYDMYSGYEERGRHYKSLVEAL
ncbi:UDP-N-acetylmuramoyl-L-alanine--D-glutamate ligase [Azotosporobacter soli]|uniref:UDP-N-acetylmuramoyl-L-alanine--D-glutamate ligase n=1 Tax=Azotosporobacter soli TaxID=3055040 RepID=UPI0031FE9A6C